MTEGKRGREGRLKGFAAIFASRLEGVSENEEFKEFSKNISIKLLLNPIDGKFAALLIVDRGTLKVQGIRNDNEEALKKKVLGWNGRIATDLITFMDFTAGKIGLGKLFKKILTRKIKVRGLLYFVLLEKLFGFAKEESEAKKRKPIVELDIKRTLMFSRVFIFSGFLHLLILFLSLGIRELVVTALVFGFFNLWLGSMLTKLIRANVIAERPILISATTLTVLNLTRYLTHIIIGTTGDRFYINYIMIIVITLDVICFIAFFGAKTRLDQMDRDEKLDYFSIVVIRGLGIGLLINLLGWIIPPNLIMIVFILLFGSLNMSYGNKLITKTEEIRVQLGALIVLIIAFVVGILIYLHVIQDPTCFVNVILLCILIPIRIYYIKKKF